MLATERIAKGGKKSWNLCWLSETGGRKDAGGGGTQL